MNADDICLLAPSALDFQKLLELWNNFNQCNDIAFNYLKSVYIYNLSNNHNINIKI